MADLIAIISMPVNYLMSTLCLTMLQSCISKMLHTWLVRYENTTPPRIGTDQLLVPSSVSIIRSEVYVAMATTGCKSLEVLRLNQVKVSDRGMGHLLHQPLECLVELDLSQTLVTTKTLELLPRGQVVSEWPSL